MLLDRSDIQAPPGVETRTESVGCPSKSGVDGVERSGNDGGDAAPEGAPWYIANRVTPPGDIWTANDRRTQRYERRQRSSEWLIRGARLEAGLPAVAAAGEGSKASETGWVRPPRPARCRWRVGETVGVHHSGDVDKGAHWSGIERCASIWACPVCSAVIRAERANDIQSAVEKWQEEDNHLVFVTLTMRHRKTDKLDVTLNAALKAWQRICQGKAWEKFKARFGVQGYVRAVEITMGQNGWHPHIHALLFTDRPMTKADQDALTSALFDRWITYVTKFGGGMPTKIRGIDVRPATKDGKVIAQYLGKLQEQKTPPPDQGIGKEMARFDFKTGRGTSVTPFELLDVPNDEEHSESSSNAYRLWNEYVKATKGRRAITWSKGLRDLVALEDEKTDEEILEESEQDDLIFLVPGQLYDRIKNAPVLLAYVLELVEKGDVEMALKIFDAGAPFRRKPATLAS